VIYKIKNKNIIKLKKYLKNVLGTDKQLEYKNRIQNK
tara:strand:+ start:9555 stop:9665 length:111 start_codon:yes stop_codon:yes gene_type:complete